MKNLQNLKELIDTEELQYCYNYWLSRHTNACYKNWKQVCYIFNTINCEDKLVKVIIVSHSPKCKLFGIVRLTKSNKFNMFYSDIISLKRFISQYGFIPKF